MFNPYEARFVHTKSTAENVRDIWISYFTTFNPWVLGQLVPVWYEYLARMEYGRNQQHINKGESND